jgi:hypothetical protein
MGLGGLYHFGSIFLAATSWQARRRAPGVREGGGFGEALLRQSCSRFLAPVRVALVCVGQVAAFAWGGVR